MTVVQQIGVSMPVASSTKQFAAGHAGAAHCAPAVDAPATKTATRKPRTPNVHRFAGNMFASLVAAVITSPRSSGAVMVGCERYAVRYDSFAVAVKNKLQEISGSAVLRL